MQTHSIWFFFKACFTHQRLTFLSGSYTGMAEARKWKPSLWYLCCWRPHNKDTDKANVWLVTQVHNLKSSRLCKHTYCWPSASSHRNQMASPFLIWRSSDPLFLQSTRVLYFSGDCKVVLKNYITNLIEKLLAYWLLSMTQRIHCFKSKCGSGNSFARANLGSMWRKNSRRRVYIIWRLFYFEKENYSMKCTENNRAQFICYMNQKH